jgi:hypothetical protein
VTRIAVCEAAISIISFFCLNPFCEIVLLIRLPLHAATIQGGKTNQPLQPCRVMEPLPDQASDDVGENSEDVDRSIAELIASFPESTAKLAII